MRGVFNQYLGWFGGDPAYIHPHSPKDKAQRMVQLAGGAKNLLSHGQEAFANNDPQWALECAQSVLRVLADSSGDASFLDARKLAVECLQQLAAGQVSANGRNYYLTYALELDGSLTLAPSKTQREGVLRQLTGADILKLLPIRINPAKCEDVQQCVLYVFPDISRAIVIEVRRGIALTYDVPMDVKRDDMFLIVTVKSSVFVDIACKSRNKTAAVMNGEMQVEGKGMTSSLALKTFMDYFDDPDVEVIAPF